MKVDECLDVGRKVLAAFNNEGVGFVMTCVTVYLLHEVKEEFKLLDADSEENARLLSLALKKSLYPFVEVSLGRVRPMFNGKPVVTAEVVVRRIKQVQAFVAKVAPGTASCDLEALFEKYNVVTPAGMARVTNGGCANAAEDREMKKFAEKLKVLYFLCCAPLDYVF